MNVQYNETSTDCKLLSDKIKEIWRDEGNKVKDLQNIELYFKPQESTCYYVINGKTSGNFSTVSLRTTR